VGTVKITQTDRTLSVYALTQDRFNIQGNFRFQNSKTKNAPEKVYKVQTSLIVHEYKIKVGNETRQGYDNFVLLAAGLLCSLLILIHKLLQTI